MLSKYRGKCATCQGVIEAGIEIDYDASAKQAHHKDCRTGSENPEALADRLGYSREFREDWKMWRMPEGNRSDSAGRASGETHRDEDPNLF